MDVNAFPWMPLAMMIFGLCVAYTGRQITRPLRELTQAIESLATREQYDALLKALTALADQHLISSGQLEWIVQVVVDQHGLLKPPPRQKK